MPIEKGDFILMDHVARVKETGNVFDTTIEEVARKENLYDEKGVYGPKLVVVGQGWVLKALDESLPNFEPKKTNSVEIPPERAFGNRDPEKVKLVPLRKLTARKITPQLGMSIEIDGKLATVRTLGSGRVQLDFNPPLAGKTLVYEVAIKKKLTTKAEKISALLHRRIPEVNQEKFGLKVSKSTVVITMPGEIFYLEGVQLAKRGIAIEVHKFFPEVKIVKFVEVFKKKEGNQDKPGNKNPL